MHSACPYPFPCISVNLIKSNGQISQLSCSFLGLACLCSGHQLLLRWHGKHVDWREREPMPTGGTQCHWGSAGFGARHSQRKALYWYLTQEGCIWNACMLVLVVNLCGNVSGVSMQRSWSALLEPAVLRRSGSSFWFCSASCTKPSSVNIMLQNQLPTALPHIC